MPLPASLPLPADLLHHELEDGRSRDEGLSEPRAFVYDLTVEVCIERIVGDDEMDRSQTGPHSSHDRPDRILQLILLPAISFIIHKE
jgi:hypothetical protein